MTEPTPDFFDRQAVPPVPPLDPAPEAPKVKPKAKAYFLPALLLLIALLSLLPGPLFFLAMILPGPLTESRTVIVPKGASIQEIARLLAKDDVVVHPLVFRAVSRLVAQDHLQAGEYKIDPEQNPIDVAIMMRDGKTVLRQVTAPEGLSSTEIAALVGNDPSLTGEISSTPEEGSLLPETYRVTFGDSRADVIERMQKAQRDLLRDLWAKRDPDLPLASPREAVIMASLVEKETGKMPSERAQVAGVFYNRLRLKMPLQTDPTVIYALTKGKAPLGRSLTKADLATPSPYNTYVNPGLPPGPICNPGRAALEAALHPDKNDYLYFVANGTGGHSFSRTLDEHNKNVTRWINLNRP